MKRNLKEEITKILENYGGSPHVDDEGEGWLVSDTVSRTFCREQLLSLFSKTLDDVIGVDDDWDDNTEAWRVATRTQHNNLRYAQRARKKELDL